MALNLDSQEVNRNCKVSTFLKKTYSLLNNNQNQDIIRWGNNGIGFVVINESLFEKEVLPKHFKHSNYSSFVRQLNMYNFHKIRQNSVHSYFHHQCFSRENPFKLKEIKRKPQRKRKITQNENQVLSNKGIDNIKLYKKPKGEEVSEKEIPKSQISIQLNDDKLKTDNILKDNATKEQLDEKVSINNSISQRNLPQIIKRQPFYLTNSHIFSFAVMPQASTFCIFY